MHRFFLPDADLHSNIVTLTEQKEIHHLKNVLRLKEGSDVVVFNGQGIEARAVIVKIGEKNVELKLAGRYYEPSKKVTVTLACAIPKNAKFETIIEKCTELGIDEIIPLITARTIVKLDTERAALKNKRYQTVAINASKQSVRKKIPVVCPIKNFKEAITPLNKDELGLIPCLFGQRKTLAETLTSHKAQKTKIIFLIGPEGDFTDDEVAFATKNGFVPVTLGSTTLKVDTAAISVAAFLNFFLSKD